MKYVLLVISLALSTACTVGSNSPKRPSSPAPAEEIKTITQSTNADKAAEENESDLEPITVIVSSLLALALLSLYLQRKIILKLKELLDAQNSQRSVVNAQPVVIQPAVKESSETPIQSISTEKLDELSGALHEAIREISRRDTTINNLTASVSRSNIQKNLVRLTQTLDAARLLQARIADGKSNPAESLDFIIDDIKSSLTDHGVEFTEILPGTRVGNLPAGSFAAISVIDAPNESLKGTVKEVRSLCYFTNEDGKKPHYIAPAKVVLYRA